MSLTPASSIVIDLILLTDAVRANDLQEARRLAGRLEKTARRSEFSTIARLARDVELVVLLGRPVTEISNAVHRLLVSAELKLYDLPSHGADWDPFRSIGATPVHEIAG